MFCKHCFRLNSTLLSHRVLRRQISQAPAKNVVPLNTSKMQPVKSLGIREQLDKIEMQQSLVSFLFLGQLDKNFMSYPQILESPEELTQINEQKKMIDKYFANISFDDPKQLQELGFNELWKMSMTEQVAYFEAMGSSSYKLKDGSTIIQLQDSQTKAVLELQEDPTFSLRHFSNLVRMIIHNNLVMPLLNCSDNKSLVEKQGLLNGEHKIAYAYAEKQEGLGAVSFGEWISEATLNPDGESWTISGSKNCIFNDNYNKYLVFCRTKNYPDDMDYQELKREKPHGMVCFLLDRTQIENIEVAEINGLTYQRIQFPKLVVRRDECQVIEPSKNGQKILTCKGIGHLAIASFLLGKLKAEFDSCIAHLTTYEPERLRNSEQLQLVCFNARNKIFNLESVVYITAGMMDAFDESSELHLEAMICKILAIDISHEVCKEMQMLFGQKRNLITSSLRDHVNLWEGFLDSNYHNTLLLGLYGLKAYGNYHHDHIQKKNLSAFFPAHGLKSFVNDVKRNDGSFMSDLDVRTYVAPSMEDLAGKIENSVKKLEYCAENLVHKWLKNVSRHQVDVTRIAKMATLIYSLICITSRGSFIQDQMLLGIVDYCSSSDLIGYSTYDQINNILSDIKQSPYGVHDTTREKIHSRNLKYGGYFAFSPLDRNIY